MGKVVDLGKGYVLTEKDFEFSKHRHNYERELVGIKPPLKKEMIFPTLIYSTLSAAEYTPKLIKIWDRLRRNKLDRLENINQGNSPKIEKILSGTRFPNTKIKRVMKLPEWWEREESQELLDEIVNSVNNNCVGKQVGLRNELNRTGPEGIGPKISSMVLQTLIDDMEKVRPVTVDKHVLKTLDKIGHKINGRNIKVPDYTTVPGITLGEYLECERIISDYAKSYGMSPGNLGYTLWCSLADIKPDMGMFAFF